EVLGEVGRRTAADKMTIIADGSDFWAKAEKAVEVLEALGAAARLEKEEDKIIIRSSSCPFGAAVKAHPEVCRVAETLVAQITGGRGGGKGNKIAVPPRCSFVITEKKKEDDLRLARH